MTNITNKKIEGLTGILKLSDDFTTYLKKEFFSNGIDKNKAILCVTADADAGEHGSALSVLMGDAYLLIPGFVKMIKENNKLYHLFSDALQSDSISSVNAIGEQIKEEISVINHITGSLVVLALWTVAVIVFGAMGIVSFITTISNLLFIAFSTGLLIITLRRAVRNRDNLKKKGAKIIENDIKKQMRELNGIIKRLKNEEDDED